MSHLVTNFCPKRKNCIQERQLLWPSLYCIAFAQLYSWKLFEFEFFKMKRGHYKKKKILCAIHHLPKSSIRNTDLSMKMQPQISMFKPNRSISWCEWKLVLTSSFPILNLTQLNLQEFKTTTPLVIANNITMGFSKKYASGSLQLTMGKIQTLWPPITDVHQENPFRNLFWQSWGLNPRN